jgi:electron transfer flavoprotein alpha/beta subunit
MRIMIAARTQVPVWTASDIEVDSNELALDNKHSEITKLFVPTLKTECEIVTGDTPGEAAVTLAEKLAKLL